MKLDSPLRACAAVYNAARTAAGTVLAVTLISGVWPGLMCAWLRLAEAEARSRRDQRAAAARQRRRRALRVAARVAVDAACLGLDVVGVAGLLGMAPSVQAWRMARERLGDLALSLADDGAGRGNG